MEYDFKTIEKKWQEKWEKQGVFRAKDLGAGEKYYCLIEFPYPSGAGLHVGHPRSYTALDIIARKKRMEGYNVLYPIGWDAFGLPAEQYAVKTGVHPSVTTKQNIEIFRRQLKSLGFSFDWSREINTSDGAYYKWTQWIFLQFFKHGLAYKQKMPVHWCGECKIVLANEEAQGGFCERCGSKVEDRMKEQWMLAITKYADRLIDDLSLVDYIEPVKIQQKNWIGRSEGAEFDFQLRGASFSKVRIFTTRPDTMFGATFIAVSPELAKNWIDGGWKANQEIKNYIEAALSKRTERAADTEKEKTGIDSGIKAINSASKAEIPVWISDYVLSNVGTGAIMGVPAHDERDFEFAKKFGLPVSQAALHDKAEVIKKFGGVSKTNYKLRDWIFSRQRYWGEPIPLAYCKTCAEKQKKDRTIKNLGWIPLPEKDLPLELPHVDDFKPSESGESPLAKAKNSDGTPWVETKCPQCGGPARRETDTMPNWAGSSWYFYRYADPGNKKVFADSKKLKYWIPVDWYNGGMEHTTLHLLYSRFWHKFLWDIGALPKEIGSEPYRKRTSHGLILAKGGEKMSKSRGNVVNPDDIVEKYGADVFRVYEMFLGPFDQAGEWQTGGLMGVKRFLQRCWNLLAEITDAGEEKGANDDKPPALLKHINRTIKFVTEDIERMGFNTAIAKMMEFINEAEKNRAQVTKTIAMDFVKILSPFAPHLCEEIWRKLGGKGFAANADWPKIDNSLLVDETFLLVIQINGKVRDQLTVNADIKESQAKAAALDSEKIKKWLMGAQPKKIVYVPGRLVNIVI